VLFACVQAVKRGVQELKQQIAAVVDVGKTIDKPLAIVLFTAGMVEAEKAGSEVQLDCLEAGFPVYPTMGRAARAITHMISWHESHGFGG